MEDIGRVSDLRDTLKIHGETIQIGGFRFMEQGIHVTGSATLDDAVKAGTFVQKNGRSQMWWLGDWVLAFESRFSEEASQYVDSTHFAESTLKKARWVCEAVPSDRRVAELSFEHHAAVSRVKDPKEQDRWLKKAVKQKWNPTDMRRAMRNAEHETKYVNQEMPEGRFRVLYADPPWPYNDTGENSDSGEFVKAAQHYPTMSLEKIKALPVRDLVGKNGVLFIWAPAPLLPDVFDVISVWGFTYKANLVWDKELPNPGHYFSVRHEHLILATRGKMVPESAAVQGIDSVQLFKRSAVHSNKPSAFRDIIDTLYPPIKSGGDRLEMFARDIAPGWKQWGNEELFQHDQKMAAAGGDGPELADGENVYYKLADSTSEDVQGAPDDELGVFDGEVPEEPTDAQGEPAEGRDEPSTTTTAPKRVRPSRSKAAKAARAAAKKGNPAGLRAVG